MNPSFIPGNEYCGVCAYEGRPIMGGAACRHANGSSPGGAGVFSTLRLAGGPTPVSRVVIVDFDE
jgi:hypothetical protein